MIKNLATLAVCVIASVSTFAQPPPNPTIIPVQTVPSIVPATEEGYNNLLQMNTGELSTPATKEK